MELLPFVDILKVFNNPINEEQAWAVCYQCALFLSRNTSQQEYFQDIYDSGIHSIWLSRHGDVFLRKGPTDPNGSGKGPPSCKKKKIITDLFCYAQSICRIICCILFFPLAISYSRPNQSHIISFPISPFTYFSN